MTTFPMFPKIPAYRGESDPLHDARRVVALEKIDGANTRVWIPGPEDRARFGGRTLAEGDEGFCQPVLREAFGDLRAVSAYARSLAVPLVLYGETCGRGVQAAGHRYGSRPRFALFAARAGEAWLSWSRPLWLDGDEDRAPVRLPSVRELAQACALTTAPCLYEGPPSHEVLDALREGPSRCAERATDREGVVLWSDPLLCDGAGRLLAAKHKDPRRRESADDATPESPEAFADAVVTDERLDHARQHLREQGRWTDAPTDERAAALCRRVVQDVAREEPSYHAAIARFGKSSVRAALEQAVRRRG